MKYFIMALSIIILSSMIYYFMYDELSLSYKPFMEDSIYEPIVKISNEFTEFGFHPITLLSVFVLMIFLLTITRIFNVYLPILSIEKLEMMSKDIKFIYLMLFISSAIYLIEDMKTSSYMELSIIISLVIFSISMLSKKKHTNGEGLYFASTCSAILYLMVFSLGIFTDNVPFVKPYFLSEKLKILGIDHYSILLIITLNLSLGLSLTYFLEYLLREPENDY